MFRLLSVGGDHSRRQTLGLIGARPRSSRGRSRRGRTRPPTHEQLRLAIAAGAERLRAAGPLDPDLIEGWGEARRSGPAAGRSCPSQGPIVGFTSALRDGCERRYVTDLSAFGGAGKRVREGPRGDATDMAQEA